jgi:hypothetical protein
MRRPEALLKVARLSPHGRFAAVSWIGDGPQIAMSEPDMILEAFTTQLPDGAMRRYPVLTDIVLVHKYLLTVLKCYIMVFYC